MYANTLPVPADRMIQAWSPTPQFAVPYNQPTQWQQYIPMITQQCATIIGNYAQRNPVRCFAYNLFSSNGWQNESFNSAVIFAIDYLSMLSETGQVRGDPQSTITQVCDDVIQGVSVMNLQDFPALQSMLDQNSLQQAQGAINAFNQMRQAVGAWKSRRQQQPMMGGMPGMVPQGMQQVGMMPGMMPQGGMGMMPGVAMPGMMPMAGMSGDPRFNGGMGQPTMQMQPQSMGVRFNMPGMPTTREDQRELAKGLINQQREILGGGGRWNKATDETIDRLQGSQASTASSLGMGSAFDSRMRAQAEQTSTKPATPQALSAIAAVSASPTPLTDVSKDQTAMTTNTSIYPDGYFRIRENDDQEDQVMVMSLYRRCIANGQLPPDALSPYDTPPADYMKPIAPAASAPVAEVPSTAKAERESAEPAEDDPAKASSQATSARWWDDPEYQIPEAIPTTDQSEQPPVAEDVKFVEVGGYSDKPKADATGRTRLGPDEDLDYTYEDEDHVHQWTPHEGQWYRPLYQPSRQVRMLKVYKDGRPSDLVVLDRNPEDIPNMDYAQHVLNTPSGRRERTEADADHALAAQQKIKEATDAYYQGVEEVKANPDIVLENPVTSFNVSLITEVEGAEATVWMISNVKRALSEKEMQEKEPGKSIDICVSNALLYEAVYCRNESDIAFLKAIYKQRDFDQLHHLLEITLSTVSKGIWETVNRRATVMLNQTLVLCMSLNEDVISPDFFANYPAIATGMAKTPDNVKQAWEKVQLQQLRTFFHEANEEDLQRNTDSVCYFLPDEKESYLNATRYLASVCTFTQLAINAADLDIALESHEVAQVTETSTPILYKVVHAIFDATSELGDRKAINHLIRTEDGVVYQVTHGALMDGALLISKRQHLWVDAR